MNQKTGEARIDPGADVLDSDGQKVGTVDYVVVHPPEFHVTDIVVSTGAILGRDVVVPIDSVDRVENDKVCLSIKKDALGALKDYVEIHYQEPPQDWVPPTGMFYPTESVVWPAGMYYPDQASVEVNAPQDTVGIHSGMEVQSSDGHKVGTIHAVETDNATGDLTEIIVQRGFLFHQDTTIPIKAVAEIKDDVVKLTGTKAEIEQRHPK